MKSKKEELTSPHLKSLEKDLVKIEKAVVYLEKERRKLMMDKEKIRLKIRKEKEILMLKKRIERVKEKK
jgi:hypothetical protein